MFDYRPRYGVVTCILSVFLTGSVHGDFRAGFSEQEIPPERGMEMPGNYNKNFNDGTVHDPLKVRAVVFGDGTRRVALVGVDAISISRHMVEGARRRIQAPDAMATYRRKSNECDSWINNHPESECRYTVVGG